MVFADAPSCSAPHSSCKNTRGNATPADCASDLVGCYPYCLDGDAAPVTIRADKSSTVYVVDGADLNEHYRQSQAAERMGRDYMAYRLVQVKSQIYSHYCEKGVRDVRKGTVVVMPHEYGTYTFKNGVYSDMGRPASTLTLTDKTHFRGRWKYRSDSWVKQPNMPEKVVRYIVDYCKLKPPPRRHPAEHQAEYIQVKLVK